ncbi:Craniofacial development protein, putative [Perkinsus marinus ATCC 50983]|uniref:Craniofacial development protein, putative n=1 Tax=Perkinsus marinus (strain ATCC 50983 / TXsc) TaxID=423536 RepID=C5L6H2_PERM5|nr:Craniofacial development protein, putative [Perkinsus marinus ATCC 50983]EER07633.1 Craniofacial development protein, putative [Perkinsus marinus ATCC 50983]|eukprot:XP_002775817.1 Craniofacial development protein, putative [Perkinsus marinus ATCC 50983]
MSSPDSRPSRGEPDEPLAVSSTADAVTDSKRRGRRQGTRSQDALRRRRAARAARRRLKRQRTRAHRDSSERRRTPSVTANYSPHSGGSTGSYFCRDVDPSVIRMYTWNVRSQLGYANRLAVVESLKAIGSDVPIIALQETRLREEVQGESLGDHILYSSPALRGIGGVGFLVHPNVRVQSWVSVSNRIAHITLNSGITIVVCYAPTEVAPQGQKDEFWDAVEEVVRLERPEIVCGDFNARLGSDLARDPIHGLGKAYAYEETNDNGWRLVMLAAASHMGHAASHFLKPQTHLGTWHSPVEKCWHQLDHFLIRSNRKLQVLDVRVRRTVMGSSDHCALELSFRNTATCRPTRRLQGRKLASRSIVDRRAFNAKVREKEAQHEFEMDMIHTCPQDGAYSDVVHAFQASMQRTGGDDITLDEVKDSLCSMDNGKAPGANGVLTSALKAGGEHCLRILHRLCKEWWSEPETIPRALGHSIIIPFYKKDLKAAFDKVPRPAIWRALRLAGCDEKLISAIESLHRNTVAQVKTQEGLSDPFPIDMGTRQGCRIAPLLFIIFMEMVIREANLDISLSMPCESEGSTESVDLSCLLFADDIVLLANDDSILQRNLDKLSAALTRFGMEVSLPKTKCMILSEGLGDSNLRLKIGDSNVEEGSSSAISAPGDSGSWETK